MTAQAVTIAITDGVPADRIGREAATRLSFRYVNDEIITTAARLARVTPEAIADVERSPSLVEQILAALARYPTEDTGMAAELLPLMVDQSPQYREVIRRVLWETGKAGQVVIGAHGASIHLATMPNVLRVLITGSPEARAAWLATTKGIAEAEARKRIDQGDRNRAAYLKRFYGVSKELPTHYDLVLSMVALPVEAAVNAIAGAAQSLG